MNPNAFLVALGLSSLNFRLRILCAGVWMFIVLQGGNPAVLYADGNRKGEETSSTPEFDETTAGSDTSPRQLLTQARRIVFLGDSITAAGDYVAAFELWLLTQRFDPAPIVIDAALPSETVSGLTEAGHAGGKFPRPVLAERLDRVLTAARPDMVIACYGMNCGIYLPFDEERFGHFQRGIENLKATVEARGACLLLLTPPTFDDSRGHKSFSYDAVLDRYSQWLLSRRDEGWMVADLHGAMSLALRERKSLDPRFTFQPDGAHLNLAGHWFVAQQLCNYFGDSSVLDASSPQAFLKLHGLPTTVSRLAKQRLVVLRNAYVSAAGHKRPGVAAGLPLAEAQVEANELSNRIRHEIAALESRQTAN